MLPSNNFFGPHINQIELYPRRRATEFYHAPQPPEEYQSRLGEHPQDKLTRNPKCDVGHAANHRIAPPRNSDMRVFRNSYFS